MQHVHIRNAEFAGKPGLFAQSRDTICIHEATMSLLSFLRTSLLDLAERKLGLFFRQDSSRSRRRVRKAASAGEAASVMARA
jgi:hypothetical protein